MSAPRKLSLLIWKNFLIQRRHKWHTLLEVVSPLLFSLILILVRGLVDPSPRPEVLYPPFNPTNMSFSRMVLATFVSKPNIYLAYSPDTNLTRDVLDKAMQRISKDNKDMVPTIPFHTINITKYIPKLLPFSNAADMENALLKPNSMSDIFAGIQFNDSLSDADSWPDEIQLTIRFPAVMRQPMFEHPVRASWRTSLQYPILPQPGPREPDEMGGGPLPGYSTEGFLAMQHAISQEIIKQKTGQPEKIDELDIKLQRFPHLPYREDRILTALERFISLIIMLCFAETAVHIVKIITVEKELQLKETMKIMGLPSWLHWLAWFINQFTFLFISVLLMVIMFKIPWHKSSTGLESYSVLTHTPWSMVLMLMSLYAAATLCFCFMISVMFARASVAASFMGLVWFMSYSLFMMVQVQVAQMSLAARLALCLVSNTAMGYAFQMCIICEGSSKGLQWSEVWEPVSYNDPFVPGHVMMMLALDCVLYMLIALYVEKVRPGPYGVPSPWYFPITKAFWCPTQYKIDVMPNQDEGAAEYAAALLEVVHDEEPVGAEIGVNIINLSKVYKGSDKKQLKAVDRLNLRLYQDEISVLLGHNGAGKTTTVSMLTGMIPPTSGTAHIAGHDIRRDTWAARSSLGLCPQHNVLFPDLTVDQHLRFFALLKGVPPHRLDAEVDHYVTLLELEEKREVAAEHLSGGQKRRLSVSLALCGGSRVVLLDEPTSGLDPAARRALWELLLRERKGRTMILTTHFMDEADVLADRIAIMSGGRLQCVGTPFFLKQHYGTGYRLTVVKSTHCNVDACTALLRRHVPGLNVNTDIGSELSYLLPNEHSSRFEALLKELELESGSLGLGSFGLSVTTLEEVFMKTGVEHGRDRAEDGNKNDIYSVSAVNGTKMDPTHLNMEFMPAYECTKVTGPKLILNHIKAMFRKRWLSSLRNYILNSIQVISVIINIVLTILVVRSWSFVTILPSMPMDLEQGYKKTVTLSAQSGSFAAEDLGYKAKQAFYNYFNNANVSNMFLQDIGPSSIADYYKNISSEDMPRVRYENLIGATFSANSITAWFSNFGYHDVAISLASVNNAVLQSLVPEATLKIHNYPLPFSIQDQAMVVTTGANIGFQLGFNVGLAMAFISSFFVLFPVMERAGGAQLLQKLSGVRPWVMWGVSLVFDWLSLVCLGIFVIFTLAAFQEQTVSTAPELGRILLVFMVFGFGMIPLHYLTIFTFSSPATGFAKMCFINTFTGVIPFMVTEILKLPMLDTEAVANALDWVFSLFPLYAMSRSIKELSMCEFALQACEEVCALYGPACSRRALCQRVNLTMCCIEDNSHLSFSEPGIGRYLFMMAMVGVISFAVLMLAEYDLLNKISFSSMRDAGVGANSDSVQSDSEAEPDVVCEERAVQRAAEHEDLRAYHLLCRRLTKRYPKLTAVDQLSFAVRGEECFGLLGVNGAGKTSTFKMLTGSEKISSGDAWVKGYSVKNQLGKVYQQIGYCPQFDALLEQLTGRETLHMFCALRGLPRSASVPGVQHLERRLGLDAHLDKLVCNYSGGNKRKLSTAIALLGNAPLVYLDEPTTGMDPAAKRRVWHVVSEAAHEGRSVVLTSHSMEECEALCTRLAIMVGGRFRCLGSPQHLKNKFSNGYTLIIKRAADQTTRNERKISGTGLEMSSTSLYDPIDKFVMSTFKDARIVETYLGVSKYYLPDTELRWWQLFGSMEGAKLQLDIADYAVMQTSLEEVFLRFTKQHSAE